MIVVDRVHHMHSFTDSPPNEFRLRETDSLVPEAEDDDQSILERAHVNLIEEPIRPLPAKDKSAVVVEKMTSSIDKENKVPEPSSINMTMSTITLNPTNDPTLDGRQSSIVFHTLLDLRFRLDILEKINMIVKNIFEIKRSQKV